MDIIESHPGNYVYDVWLGEKGGTRLARAEDGAQLEL